MARLHSSGSYGGHPSVRTSTAQAWQLEPSRMLMVGDSFEDVECGNAAGYATCYIQGGRKEKKKEGKTYARWQACVKGALASKCRQGGRSQALSRAAIWVVWAPHACPRPHACASLGYRDGPPRAHIASL